MKKKTLFLLGLVGSVFLGLESLFWTVYHFLNFKNLLSVYDIISNTTVFVFVLNFLKLVGFILLAVLFGYLIKMENKKSPEQIEAEKQAKKEKKIQSLQEKLVNLQNKEEKQK